jgi:phospholipid transport system substrate-binding protein
MRLFPIAVGLLVAAPPPLAWAKTPLERTADLVELTRQLKNAEEGQSLPTADREANAAIYKRLDDFYDFHTLASEPLEPHKAKLTAAQQAKIKPIFEELIRLVAYPKSGTFLREAEYQIKTGPIANDTQMDVSAPKQDFKTSVVFHWKSQGSTWRIIDVSFDGASLIQDYKNQFGRIISKEGGDGLVKKLSTRLEKERQKQGV